MTDELKPNPSVDQDPEVIAEAKKNRIWHLKLERWKETAGAVGVILQTFKAEAVSLVSGAGTLVIGWFQIRKWAVQGRHEVRQIAQEGAGAARGRPQLEASTSAGEGYGSGYGAGQAARPTAPARGPVFEDSEVVGVPASVQEPSALADPMTYVPAGTLAVFLWSTFIAWRKRKQRQADQNGGK